MRRSLARYRRTIVGTISRLFGFLLPTTIGRNVRRRASKVTKTATSTATAITSAGSGLGRPRRQWKHLLFAVPALVCVLGIVFFTYRSISKTADLGRDYWRRGIAAMKSGEFKTAQLFLSRAQGLEGMDPREVDFAMAVVYEKLGMIGRGQEVIRRLAPNGRPGFDKAHRHLAIVTAANRGVTRSSEKLQTWLWHLSQADEQESSAMQEAWGRYYLAVDDLGSAIEALSNAATAYPNLLITIAGLQQRLGKLEQRRQTLVRARDEFRPKLEKNPGDREARLVYATSLLGLGELEEAERVLRTGMRIDPDGPFSDLLAAVFVQLYDRLEEQAELALDDETKASQKALALDQLRNALELEPNFRPALERLLSYASVDASVIPRFRKMLSEVLASGSGTALAHLALSNLAWLEDDSDKAEFHLDQAISMDKNMPVVANNLAWLLAHQEEPELERAQRIIDKVVEDFPDSSRFLDTRGTILLLQERYKDALADLEKAAPDFPNKTAIYTKIANAYDELGMDDLAKAFRRKAG